MKGRIGIDHAPQLLGRHLRVHGERQEAENFAPDRSGRQRTDEDLALSVFHELDQLFVADLVDPTPSAVRDPGGAAPNRDPARSCRLPLRPTEPISGSVKVTRGIAR